MPMVRPLLRHNNRPTLSEAKEKVTIPCLWRMLGLRGTPAKSCASPFRDDRHASFSVYCNDRRWKDFSTGEGGDVIDFLAKAKGLNNRQACLQLLTIANGGNCG